MPTIDEIRILRTTAGTAYKAKHYTEDVDVLLAEIDRLKGGEINHLREENDNLRTLVNLKGVHINPKRVVQLLALEQKIFDAGYLPAPFA